MPSARAIRSYLRSLALPPIPLLSLSPARWRGLRAALGHRLRRSRPCGQVLDRSAFGTRCPLRSGNRVLAALRAAPLPGPPLRRSHGLRSRPRTRSGWRRLGERITPPRHAGSLCHACSLRQPRRRRGPPLRSGARGSARRRARATVAQAQPPLRPAKTQAKLRQGLAPAPSPRPDAKLHQPRVAPLRARVPKNRHIGDRPRT